MLATDKEAEDRARAGKFYRLLQDPGATEQERVEAKQQLDKLLAKLGLTMADAERIAKEDVTDEDEPVTPKEMLIAVMDLLREYVWHPDERIYLVAALWILHTHVYRQFRHTPRLLIYAPLSNSGKSNLMTMVRFLSAGGDSLDGVTSASLFRDIDEGIRTGKHTKFVDEMDHAEFDNVFYKIFDDGLWSVKRDFGIENRRFEVFFPLCFGAINKKGFKPQQLNRSHLIKLQKKGKRELDKEIVNEEIPSEDICDVCYLIDLWVSSVGGNNYFDGTLDRSPANPLFDRDKDRWRPLFSIADACGFGAEAREIATSPEFATPETDLKVLMAKDMRKVFDALKPPQPRDRIWTETAAKALWEIHESPWGGEWCGPDDKHQPHRIRAGELARFMRREWETETKSIWIGDGTHTAPGDVSKKGWERSQFEPMWDEVGLEPTSTAMSTERRTPARRKAASRPTSKSGRRKPASHPRRKPARRKPASQSRSRASRSRR
jgi:Protein of unknown function (DUF3631)